MNAKMYNDRKDAEMNKGKLFCVVADAGVAHEAECVYSIWPTEKKAELEIDRLVAAKVHPGCNGGSWMVVSVQLERQSDVWIHEGYMESL